MKESSNVSSRERNEVLQWPGLGRYPLELRLSGASEIPRKDVINTNRQSFPFEPFVCDTSKNLDAFVRHGIELMRDEKIIVIGFGRRLDHGALQCFMAHYA